MGAWGRDPVLGNPYYRRELASLVERAGEAPIRTLLDLGAGFGRASAPFRARVERGVLLEGSSWMLGQIRLSAEEAGGARHESEGGGHHAAPRA